MAQKIKAGRAGCVVRAYQRKPVRIARPQKGEGSDYLKWAMILLFLLGAVLPLWALIQGGK